MSHAKLLPRNDLKQERDCAMATLGNIITEPLTIEFTASGHRGVEVAKMLAQNSFELGKKARSCLSSRRIDGYDNQHRLRAGMRYTVVILPGPMLCKADGSTTKQIIGKAERLGYQRPRAGVMPYVRSIISDSTMRELGLWFISALHQPIKDSDGTERILSMGWYGEGRRFDALDITSTFRWQPDGAFVFEVR